MRKHYIVTFKVDAVNGNGLKIIDKFYQRDWVVPMKVVNGTGVAMSEEECLTEENLDSLASQLVLEITNSLSNQQLTPEMQKQILPDWSKSSVIPIGIIPLYVKDEVSNDKTPSNS